MTELRQVDVAQVDVAVDTAEPAIDPLVFRSIMGTFPTGVTIVTTLDEQQTPRGLTVNAFMSVSADPPLLAVCISKRSSTLAALKHTGAFAVHVLGAASAELSRRFAAAQCTDDRFADLRWVPSETACGVPLLRDGAVAVVEALVDRIVPAGDHELVFGRIVGGQHTADQPLLYHRSQYASWPVLTG